MVGKLVWILLEIYRSL